MPRKPRCRNEFLAVQYALGTPGHPPEAFEIKAHEFAGTPKMMSPCKRTYLITAKERHANSICPRVGNRRGQTHRAGPSRDPGLRI